MPTQKPYCKSVRTWLVANLSKGCLAALTGTDSRALDAAVHIVELMAYAGVIDSLAQAFGAVVMEMQPETRYLAYHSVAHVLDWSDRERVWVAAGLPSLGSIPECEHAS